MFHHISSEPEIEHMAMLPTSDIPSYDLLDLNFKISDRPLSRHILDKNSEPEQTLTYIYIRKLRQVPTEMKKNFNAHEKTLPYT